ncbi:hypothetical protein CHELA1G11_11481 [Hyphomicrobiales bacterium]|nr:hypothetical protein CHELA1G11_11481 [Hyphomicrobiales bacterium]CAH1667464.1 hypothetical protein CHELA1G2_12828 [Hyphomicrobiales bacterium]
MAGARQSEAVASPPAALQWIISSHALQVAHLHLAAAAIRFPHAAGIARLAFIEMDDAPALAVVGLVGEVVAADAHVLSKANLGMGGENAGQQQGAAR